MEMKMLLDKKIQKKKLKSGNVNMMAVCAIPTYIFQVCSQLHLKRYTTKRIAVKKPRNALSMLPPS